MEVGTEAVAVVVVHVTAVAEVVPKVVWATEAEAVPRVTRAVEADVLAVKSSKRIWPGAGAGVQHPLRSRLY